MTTAHANLIAPPTRRLLPAWRLDWRLLPLVLGVVALVIPTMQGIAAVSWSTEQGAHGPIVLSIALWLFIRRWPAMRALAAPGSGWRGGIALALCLLAYIVFRIVGSIVLESAALYGALVATLYLLVGWRAMRAAWFPIAYFLFVLPPPGSLVATATQPLRLGISGRAVSLLAELGLPVAQSGLTIYIDQYALEVKAACSGLNSIISLSAIGLFYIYMRHHAKPGYMAVMGVVIVGMAVLANFVRVISLILITYFFGNEAAQGYLHQFAGMTMFVVALAGTIAADSLVSRWWRPRQEDRA